MAPNTNPLISSYESRSCIGPYEVNGVRDSKKYTLKTNKSSNLKRKLRTRGQGLEPVEEESDASI